MAWETDAEKRPTRITLLTGLLYLQGIMLIAFAVFGATYTAVARYSSSVVVATVFTLGVGGFLIATGFLIYRQRRSGFYMLVTLLVLETASRVYGLLDPVEKFEVDFDLILYLATLFVAVTTFKWFMTGRWKRLS